MSHDQSEGISSPRGLETVKQIPRYSETITNSLQDIPALIEEPLRSAVQNLYDRNIHTYMSSANPLVNADGVATLSLYTKDLSPLNRIILDSFVQEGAAHIFNTTNNEMGEARFSVPPGDAQWVDRVRELSNAFAERFEPQAFLWCPRFGTAELAQVAGISVESAKVQDRSYWDETGLVFDPKTELYFMSIEHIQKFHDSMAKFQHDKFGNPIEKK